LGRPLNEARAFSHCFANDGVSESEQSRSFFVFGRRGKNRSQTVPRQNAAGVSNNRYSIQNMLADPNGERFDIRGFDSAPKFSDQRKSAVSVIKFSTSNENYA
jgi:hypothetical protein